MKKVLLIIITVLIVVSSLLLYGYTTSKNDIYKYSLSVFKDDYDVYCFNSINCNKYSFSIPTITEDAKILDISLDENHLKILYLDNVIKIYDKNTNTITNLDEIPKDYNKYHIIEYIPEDTNNDYELYGITYYNNEYNIDTTGYHFYDLKMKKERFKNYIVGASSKGYLELINNYKKEGIEHDAYLVNIETEEIIYELKNLYFTFRLTVDNDFIILTDGDVGEPIRYIFTRSGNKITSGTPEEQYQIFNNNLYTISYNNDSIIIYDSKGNIIDEKKYDDYKIFELINNYAIIYDSNHVYLVNTSDDSKTFICDLDNGKFLDDSLMYYSGSLKNDKNKYGLYVGTNSNIEECSLPDNSEKAKIAYKYLININTKEIKEEKVCIEY